MIGKLLGHADVRTTTRYAHLDDGHVIEAAQRIGNLIEEMMGGTRDVGCGLFLNRCCARRNEN